MANVHRSAMLRRLSITIALASAGCEQASPGAPPPSAATAGQSSPQALPTAPLSAGAAGAIAAGATAPLPINSGASAGSAAPIDTVAITNSSAGSGAAGAPAVTTPSYKVSINVPGIAAGVEGTQCIQVRLPNTAPINVVTLHNTLSPASHHFIVTAVTDEAAPEKPLADCPPFRGAIAGAPLAITQSHNDLVQMPEGIGYRLSAGQILHLELHYLNVSDKTQDVTAESELFEAAPGTPLQEGAVLLVGTTDVNLPPRAATQSPLKYLALPAGMEDVKFYAITGHTHRFGTNVTVASATPGPLLGPPTQAEALYSPEHFDWEAPEMKQLSPHVSVPAGGGFTIQCAWNNTSDNFVTWGESALAEMCFFWGYYYPRKSVATILIDNLDPNVLKLL